LDFKKAWDEQLALIEFSYNNSYHSSIGMAPYWALYGRGCRTPLCWKDIDKSLSLGPELIEATIEKVRIIQEWMRAAQSCQKSYVDRRRKPLEFKVADKVFLKVFPRGLRDSVWQVSLASITLDLIPSRNELGK